MAYDINQIDIRSEALKIARAANSDAKIPAELLIKEAEKIEKYLWGKFAPSDKAPTPMSTIEEAAAATKAIVIELLENTADPVKLAQIRNALMFWERFMADMEIALKAPTA